MSDTYNLAAQFLADTLANAAGIKSQVPVLKNTANIEITDWRDWVRIIAGFEHLSQWHEEAWDWAWNIELGVYQSPFVAIAPRGSGKSSTVEAMICALGARDTRKHVLYVRATQAQANASIANIATILESGPIGGYYPLMADRLIGAFGKARGWNRSMLRTASGFTVVGFGLDSSLRGFKVDNYRPDLICHKMGTSIYDPSLGYWLKVEKHPGALGIRHGAGKKVSLVGLPTPEVVTPEHQYWARELKSGQEKPEGYNPEPHWVQAKDLQRKYHFIGLPISTKKVSPPPIPYITLNKMIVPWQTEEEYYVPDEFNDPDWWWLFGRWWRKGGFLNEKIYMFFRFADNPYAEAKLIRILDRYQIPFQKKKSTLTLKRGETRPVFYITFKHNNIFRWLHTWTNVKNEYRVPPGWVEEMDPVYQKQLMLGYIDWENTNNAKKEIEIATSAHEELYVLRRIMARLGVPALIHKIHINRKNKKDSFCLYAIGGVKKALGLNVNKIKDNKAVFISRGHLWSRVFDVEDTEDYFVPVQTETHTYYTHAGKSHNCLDDIDSKHDSPAITEKKIETITTSILPAGSQNMTAIAIQNLVISTGIFARFADGTADFLGDRVMIGPIQAVEDLTYRVINNISQITGGTATWAGQSIVVCEEQMKKWGIKAFLAEAQHQIGVLQGGTFDGVEYTHITEAELPDLARIVCWIDPAVSSTTRSDCQAIQIDGIERIANPKLRPRIFRLYSWEGIATPSNMIKQALREGTARHVETIGFETNQGGDLWEDQYLTIAGDMLDAEEIEYIPTFASEKAGAHTGGKEDRASRMLTDYTRGYMVHVEGTHTTLENALGRFPLIAPDDLVDAAYWAWNDLRSKDKWRGKPRHGRISKDKLFGGNRVASGSSRRSHLRRLGLR